MYEQYLQHHGVLGMKWGVRRYQNKDGTLTSAGKRHEKILDAKSGVKIAKSEKKAASKAYSKSFNKAYNSWQFGKKATERWDDAADKAEQYREKKAAYKKAKSDYKQTKKNMEAEAAAEKGSTVGKERAKKAVKVGAAVAGTALAAYGTYKVTQYVKEKAGQRAYEIGMKNAHNSLDSWGSMALKYATQGDVSGYTRAINYGNSSYEKHFDQGIKKAAQVSSSTKEAVKFLRDTKNTLKYK